jgi:hypothetical protein
MSAAYCEPCSSSGAIPLWALKANTVVIGGMRNADTWWFEVVHTTLAYLGITCQEFDEQVDREIAQMRADLDQMGGDPT